MEYFRPVRLLCVKPNSHSTVFIINFINGKQPSSSLSMNRTSTFETYVGASIAFLHISMYNFGHSVVHKI